MEYKLGEGFAANIFSTLFCVSVTPTEVPRYGRGETAPEQLKVQGAQRRNATEVPPTVATYRFEGLYFRPQRKIKRNILALHLADRNVALKL
jgi:hypothetical protein